MWSSWHVFWHALPFRKACFNCSPPEAQTLLAQLTQRGLSGLLDALCHSSHSHTSFFVPWQEEGSLGQWRTALKTQDMLELHWTPKMVNQCEI